MAQQIGRTFEDMQSRLEQIAEEVSAEDISLDEALALYEEAVKLGLAACDLSESDVEAYLAASSLADEGQQDVAALKEPDGAATDDVSSGEGSALANDAAISAGNNPAAATASADED